ncbi:hypothetical protein Tco_1058032 [Tanacetum coccineum]|uniref:Uncharacterized protein n=1 Tax=Tanacetum coccineum TaxID=301880 RepID=A0ABQ5H719_9ASTR
MVITTSPYTFSTTTLDTISITTSITTTTPYRSWPTYEVRESSSAARPTGGLRADYGFVATMDRKIRQVMSLRTTGLAQQHILEVTVQTVEQTFDYKMLGGRSQEAEADHRGTEADKETSDLDGRV